MLTAKCNYDKQGIDCAEIDWQGLEHRELSAGFKEWKYEK